MIDVQGTMQEVLSKKNENHEHGPRVPGIFYASEALQCHRKVYLKMVDPRPDDDLPLGLFYMGKAVEEAIITHVRMKYGLNVEEQVRLDIEIAPGIRIHGYLDFCIKNDKGKIKEIFEIKSTSMIRYMEKEKCAKPHHRGQLQCYLSGFKCLEGAVLYVERGDLLKMKQFNDYFDEELWQEIVDGFVSIVRHIEKGTPPPPIPVEDWECKYCDRSKECTQERREDGIVRTKNGLKKVKR
jgi:CRISPR/Cas system-associated exonuclease Cas4 (RecB family)